jgi:CubicO group peptidase (beta-lactamase class C family)
MYRSFLRSTLFVSVLLAVAVAVPACSSPSDPDAGARIDSVFADVDRPDGPGCAVGVLHDGTLTYDAGYGLANLDYRRPITSETAFFVASLSKQFTAAAVLRARQKDLLSLDDPVRKWLHDFPEYTDGPIRVRHLIHHTSGLRSSFALGYLAGWDDLDDHSVQAYLDLIYRQEGLNFAPGTNTGYSNTNYILLAEIIEAATGASLRQFADSTLFEPLGMTDTHFHDDKHEVVRNRAIGYRPSSDGFVMNHPWDYEIVGPGGLYTTLEDLARWDRNFDTGTVGGDAFADRMTTPGRLADGDTTRYAFGLRLGTYRDRRTVEHGGALEGFRAQYVRFPADDRSVVVLCNTRVDAKARADSVADLVLPRPLASEDRESDDAPRRADLAPEDLQPHVGLYAAPDDGYFRVFVEEGRLMAERSRAFRIPLRPVGPRRFTAPGPIDAFAFRGPDPGRSGSVAVYRSTDTTTFRRVTPAEYPRAARSAFAGTYHSDELGADYRVRNTDDGLELIQGDRPPLPLRPGAADEFRLRNGFLRFARTAGGAVSGFTLYTRRVAGLHFDRRPASGRREPSE